MEITLHLDHDFEEEYARLKEEYGPEMAKLNGFSDEQLNYTSFIDNFIDKAVTDASIDGNANVSHKDILSLENEMAKPHSKLLAFNKIFYEMKKEYGLEEAKRWLRAEWRGDFYMHDAPSVSYKPYCYAYSLEEVVNRGLFFIDTFNSQPPEHLSTFFDFVAEFISFTCNRSSGAVGLPDVLVYAYYFWKKDVEHEYYTDTPERYRDQNFQSFIYRLNQPFLRGGAQSAFTNVSIFDQSYYEALFGGKEYPDGTFMIDYMDEIMEFQKAFMRMVSDIRSMNMMTFPVLTYSLLRKDGKFVNEEFAKWCCAHNMKWNDSNFYVSEDVTTLSNCCRLLSSIKNLSFFNSIGGTALSVGSIKVNTINLARIAYESTTLDEYIDKLKDRTVLCLKALDRVRHIIMRNIGKGLLPNYQVGLIDAASQYNTVGIVALYETLKHYGMTKVDEFGNTSYTNEGIEFAKHIMSTINETAAEFVKDKNYASNLEQVPAERAAAILEQKDILLFKDGEYDLPLYGNQWIPLAVKCSLDEKVKLSAILDKACNGGSIAHINLDKPIEDFDTAWKLLSYVADAGVIYFAFNVRISACNHNHGFYGDVCPECGESKVTTYQRIVGFLTPEKSYSKERKAEFAMRDWFAIGDDL